MRKLLEIIKSILNKNKENKFVRKFLLNREIANILKNINCPKDKIHIINLQPVLSFGGAERVAMDFARILDKNKYYLTLVGVNFSDNKWYEEYCKHYDNVVYIGDHKDKEKKYILKKIAKKTQPKIILMCNLFLAYDLIPDFRKNKNAQLIDFHHLYGDNLEIYSTPYIKYFNHRIAISNSMKNKMIEYYKKEDLNFSNKIKILYNGLDIKNYINQDNDFSFRNQFKISKNDFVVSYIGRISNVKKPKKIIKIANELINNRNLKNLKFIIAGDGHLLSEIKQMITNLNLKNSVFTTGYISETSIILKESNCLILTSINEGTPYVIFEAMAMKCPVISTNVGAISEVVKDKENGFLIEYSDKMENDFIEIINQLQQDKSLCEKISEAAFKTLTKRFDIEIMRKEYNLFFDKITEKQ